MQRIYVASLSDYNAGRLHGVWIDAAQPAEDISAEVSAMLAGSPEPIAEEWAIHDHEGFGGWSPSEWESFETVSAVAMAIDEHGEAFAAWLSNYGRPGPEETGDDLVSSFEDDYRGEYDKVEDYAAELIEEGCFGDDMSRVFEDRSGWIDLEQIARDLTLGGDIWTAETGAPRYGVWIFGS